MNICDRFIWYFLTDALGLKRAPKLFSDDAPLLNREAALVLSEHHLPDRISEQSGCTTCQICAMHGVCHTGKVPAISCRNCCHGTYHDKDWRCELANCTPPEHIVNQGCQEHLYLPYLLPWSAVNGGPGWVLYENDVCNCTAGSMPTITGNEAPVILTSEMMVKLGAWSKLKNMELIKEMFGEENVE